MKTARKIISNLFSLTFAEITSKGLLFLANAYLARTIMPEGFGIIGVANSITVYLMLFSNLGFNTLGSREIAKDRGLIPKYVNNINTARLILSALVFAVYVVIIGQVNLSANVKTVYLIAAMSVFANAFLIDWVYLGIERMGVLAVRQVLTSLLNLVGIYLFVHGIADTVFAISVFTGTTFVNSIWLIILYIKEFGMYKPELDLRFLKTILKSTIHIAYYIFFVTVLNTISINMLKIMAPTEQAGDFATGIFNAATKIYVLAILPSSIIQQAFFPLLSRSETAEDRHRAMEKYTLLIFLLGCIITLGILTFAPFIIHTVFGAEFAPSSPVLQYLMGASFFVFVNTAFTVPLLSWKYERYSTYAIIVGTIVNLAGNYILIPLMGPEGSGLATMMAEFSIAATLVIFIYRIMKKVYVMSLLKLSLFAALSCAAGYFLWQAGLYAIVAGSLSIVIYAALNLAFKTITVTEIMGYFKK